MKPLLIRLTFVSFLITLVFAAQAQSKSPVKKKSSSGNEIPPPPPPKKGDEEPVKIGTLEEVPLKDEALEKPVMNFDTSHAAQDAFTADILLLMKVTGALDLGIIMAKGIEDKKMTEKSPMMKEFYTRFYDELEHGAVNRHLINYFVKTYRKHFTHEEIKSLIAFYETEIGKKAIKVMPQLTQDAMEYGRKVGEYYGQKIMYELMLEQEKKSN